MLCAGVAAATAGHTGRACGFDMDRDGVIGGPQDCSVCDGVTVDPDGDGVEEDINYVDASSGVDSPSCGSALEPCATLAWVISGSNVSYPKRVDGAASSDPEDILCVKGTQTLTETLLLETGGAPGSYAADLYPGDLPIWGASGSESFRYPSNPLMIVGWDADGDGSYPPFDTDDTAEIDADPLDKLFVALTIQAGWLEVAHLTWGSFGEGDTNGTTASGLAVLGPDVDHVYLHDLRLRDVNRLSRNNSSRALVNVFPAEGTDYFAFVNNQIERMSGFGFRGSCSGCADFRVDHNTATVEALNETQTDEPGVTWYRAWDTMTRVSVSYNDLDASPEVWTPTGNTLSLGIAISICVQDALVRGNRLVGFRESFRVRVTSSQGECSSRPVKGLVVDRNLSRQGYAGYTFDRHLFVESGNSPNLYLEDLLFANNVLVNTVEMEDALLVWGGSDDTDFVGTYRFVNNTVFGDFARGVFSFDGVAANNADVLLYNNSFEGSASRNVDFQYSDAALATDHNAWEGTAEYRYRSSTVGSLTQWQGLGFDLQGDECAPQYVSAPDDLHLAPTDVCALDHGGDASSWVVSDFEGDARPQGDGWDIGADELDAPLALFGDDFESGDASRWQSSGSLGLLRAFGADAVRPPLASLTTPARPSTEESEPEAARRLPESARSSLSRLRRDASPTLASKSRGA